MNTYGNGIPRQIPDLYAENSPKNSQTEVFNVLHPTNNQLVAKLVKVNGYGRPGAVVWAAFNKSEPMITTVKADGSWEFPLNFGFADGNHQLNLTHYHSGTNTHKRIDFKISSGQQSEFAVISPKNGDVIDDFYPIIFGSALPGESIEGFCEECGTALCTATAEGNFAFRFSAALSPGKHSVTVKTAGGESAVCSFTIIEPMLVPSEKFSTPIVRTAPKPTGNEKTYETTITPTTAEDELEATLSTSPAPPALNHTTPDGTKYADPANIGQQKQNFTPANLNTVVAQHQNPSTPNVPVDEVFNTVKGLSYDEIKALSAQTTAEAFTPFDVPHNAGEAVFEPADPGQKND